VVEEEVALTVQHLWYRGRQDLVVVAVEPEVRVLPNVGGVVAGVKAANVVDHSVQHVLVVAGNALIFLLCAHIVPGVRNERGHVDYFWEIHPGGNLLV